MRDRIAFYLDVSEPRNVGAISLAHATNEFFAAALPPVLPLLVADLNMTYGQAGLLVTVFFVMYSVFQLPAGMIADRVGKKRLLVVGLIGTAGGIFLAGVATDYRTLVLAQVIAGISGSTYHPAGMSLISDLETRGTEGRAMGVFGFGGMAGVAAAPVLIGGLASLYNWRIGLLTAALAGVGVTGVFAVAYRGHGRDADAVSDPVSDLDGKTRERNLGTDGENRGDGGGGRTVSDEREAGVRPDGSAPGLAGQALAAVERTLRFRFTVTVLLLAVVTALVSLQVRAIITFTTAFLVESFGRSNSEANAVFFVYLAASSIASLYVGSLGDRLDRSRVGSVAATIAAIILVVSAGAATVAGDQLDGPGLTVGLAVLFAALGFAVYGCTPIKNAVISAYAETTYSGSLFGVTQTASAIGSAVGPAAFGALATVYGMNIAFPAIAAIGILIAVLFVLLGRSLD